MRVMRTGDLAVNPANRSAEVQGRRVHVTGKEFQILELLSLRKPRAVTREELFKHLYDDVDQPGLEIIDVFIAKLRKKIADASGDKNFIMFVEGDGYQLVDPDDPDDPKTPSES
jgi:two-component system cell cycle response regulator CtrA